MTDDLGGWEVERVLRAGPRLVGRARRPGEAPVVLKATRPGDGWRARAALRREARLLEAASGEGVVGLLDVVDRRGRTALVLPFVPGGSLADRPPPAPEPTMRLLQATVDRLHRVGLAHTALTPDHVLLAADATPVLCGFGNVRPAVGPPPDLDPFWRLDSRL